MTDNEKMTKILSDIMTITDTKCLRIIYTTAQSRRENMTQVIVASWCVNDDVQMSPEHQHKRPYGAKGKIKKINPKKMQVDFNGKVWNVPKTMLMKI